MNMTKSTKLRGSNWRLRIISRNCTLAALLALAPAAWGQFTQNTVTGSRALNTAYQNLSGVPMIAMVTPNSSAGGSPTTLTVNLFTDAVNPPTTQTSANYSINTNSFAIAGELFALVCPNNYYKVTATAAGSAGISYWIETTIDDVGSGCTQNIVTGSRAIGTIYHNASGLQTIWLSVTCSSASGDTCTAFADSSATPTTRIGYQHCASTHSCTLFFPVLPGYYYQITRAGDATLSSWTETTTNTPPGMTQSVSGKSIGIPVSHSVYSAGSKAVFLAASATGSVPPAGTLYTSDASTSSVVEICAETHLSSTGSFMVNAVPATWFYSVDFDQSSFSDPVWVEWSVPSTPPAQTRNHAYVF